MTLQYASFPKLVCAKSARRRQSVVMDCACAQSSADTASSGSVSNGFTLGLFRIHSEKFLTDRGVPCFKKSKAELVLLGKEAENRYRPIEPDDHVKS